MGVKSSISHRVSEEQCGLGQYTPPGFTFQNLYGCTINISAPNCTINIGAPNSSSSVPASARRSVTESLSEVEIDRLIASVKEPSSE